MKKKNENPKKLTALNKYTLQYICIIYVTKVYKSLVQLHMDKQNKQALNRIRGMFDFKINANTDMSNTVNDILLDINDLDSNNNNFVETIIKIKSKLELIKEQLLKFVAWDNEIYELWKLQKRCPRNKYKGVKEFLDIPVIVQDRFNKGAEKLMSDVRICFYVFLFCYFFFFFF